MVLQSWLDTRRSAAAGDAAIGREEAQAAETVAQLQAGLTELARECDRRQAARERLAVRPQGGGGGVGAAAC